MMNSEFGSLIYDKITFLEGKARRRTDNGKRNILNKWFQDTVKSFLLDKIAAPLLVKPMGAKSADEIKKEIHQNLPKKLPRYMGIILVYFQKIDECGESHSFIKSLEVEIKAIKLLSDSEQSNYNNDKKIRASFVAYLLYNFFKKYIADESIYDISSFFQIWQLSFPDAKQEQRRRNAFQLNQNPQVKEEYIIPLLPKSRVTNSNQENLNHTDNNSLNGYTELSSYTFLEQDESQDEPYIPYQDDDKTQKIHIPQTPNYQVPFQVNQNTTQVLRGDYYLDEVDNAQNYGFENQYQHPLYYQGCDEHCFCYCCEECLYSITNFNNKEQ